MREYIDIVKSAIEASVIMEKVHYFGGFKKAPAPSDTSRYMQGWCPYFALALHDLYGWQIVSGGEHFAVRRGDGLMVDVRGVSSPAQFQDGINAAATDISRDELVNAIESGEYQCGYYREADLTKAKTLIRRLGIEG